MTSAPSGGAPGRAEQGLKRLKLALIGTSHPHSAMFQETVLQVPELDVVAIYSDGGKVNDAFLGVQTYTSVKALLAGANVDAALITVPNSRGEAVTTAVAGAGVPFITDKPVCRDANEMRRVVRAVKDANSLCVTGYVNRFRPTHLKAKELIQLPEFGPVRAVSAYLFATDVKSRGAGHYLFNHSESGGGVLHWLGCHVIDALRHVTGGEFTEVKGTLANLSGAQIDVEDFGALTFKLTTGAIGTLMAGYAFPHASDRPYERSPKDTLISVWGANARLDYEPLGERLSVTWFTPKGGGPTLEEYRLELPPVPGYVGALGAELVRRFADQVRAGATAAEGDLPDEQDNLSVLEVLEAAYEGQ